MYRGFSLGKKGQIFLDTLDTKVIAFTMSMMALV